MRCRRSVAADGALPARALDAICGYCGRADLHLWSGCGVLVLGGRSVPGIRAGPESRVRFGSPGRCLASTRAFSAAAANGEGRGHCADHAGTDQDPATTRETALSDAVVSGVVCGALIR